MLDDANRRASTAPPLDSWMTKTLWAAAAFNVLAGFGMLVFYHEGFRLLGIDKPKLEMPTQLVGLLVMLFGWGYAMVARDPFGNANVLRLGFWSKALGSVLTFYHYFAGNVPWALPVLVLFADVVWLFPFGLIHRRLKKPLAIPGER